MFANFCTTSPIWSCFDRCLCADIKEIRAKPTQNEILTLSCPIGTFSTSFLSEIRNIFYELSKEIITAHCSLPYILFLEGISCLLEPYTAWDRTQTKMVSDAVCLGSVILIYSVKWTQNLFHRRYISPKGWILLYINTFRRILFSTLCVESDSVIRERISC